MHQEIAQRSDGRGQLALDRVGMELSRLGGSSEERTGEHAV
jgi:hypothetical protein